MTRLMLGSRLRGNDKGKRGNDKVMDQGNDEVMGRGNNNERCRNNKDLKRTKTDLKRTKDEKIKKE